MTWYAPGIYDNYYNYYSNIVVQNATASPVNITVDIYAPGNPMPIKTQTANNVPAYASANFEQAGLAELSDNVAYSAKSRGTGNVAPIVNIYGLGSGELPTLLLQPVFRWCNEILCACDHEQLLWQQHSHSNSECWKFFGRRNDHLWDWSNLEWNHCRELVRITLYSA